MNDPASTQPESAPSRHQVFRMFDRIAHRYDLLNRLLSFGRDVAWRKALVRLLPGGERLRLLDLATGTADVLIAAEQQTGRIAFGAGLDPSWGMLRHGLAKIRRRAYTHPMGLLRGDGAQLPLPDAYFDAITIAFGIRNYADVERGLREMRRVLAPGGRTLILEFSLPPNALFRFVYLAYFRHVLPKLGGIISGDFHAYSYLNQTVETFPYGEAFCALMREAGFARVEARPLSFGIATIYVGDVRAA